MTDRGAAPRIALLFPLVFVLHVAEEWFGDFPGWTSAVLGDGVSAERFLVINAVGLVLITAGAVVAVREPGAAWLAVSIAALLALNGIVHALATLGWGRYSPGTVTGLLLSLPLGIAVLRASRPRIAGPGFAGAALLGVALHALVTLTALA